MPESTSVRIVPADRLAAVTAAIFEKLGVPAEDARFLGSCLVDADLRGVHSHGTRYVSVYVNALRRNNANPRPTMRAVRDEGATAVYDADGGLGHITAARAMQIAIDKAKEYGTGTVSLRNSRHIGALAYYTQMAADAGCIGFCTTNAGIMMAPYGGRDRLIGLNPLSWAVPTNRPWSVNLDMATSVVAGSKLGMAIERGEKIPIDWALDENGQPTDDPREALKGVLLPIAGPKGYGLAVILDILAGVLSGGRFGKELGGPGSSQLYQAIDISRFMPLEEFKARMDQLIDQIKGSALAPGSKGIFLPGEIEWENKQRRLKEGIPMTGVVIDDIDRIAAELEIDDRPSRWT